MTESKESNCFLSSHPGFFICVDEKGCNVMKLNYYIKF